MKKATAKSLAKTAVLDASDKPEYQDKARERRVKMDFASWRKQTKAGKTTHREEVGISSAAKMKEAQKEAELRKKEQDAVRKEKEALKKEEVQVDEVYKKLPVAKMAKKISDKSFKSGQSGVSTKSAEQTGKMIGVLDTHDPQRSKAKSKIKEAKVDIGKSADEKAKERNLRNTPPGADKNTDLKTFLTRKPGESLDKARQRVRQGQHAARRGVSEAKVDTGDDVKKETDRNKRRFGRNAAPRGSGGVEYAQTLVRRREHRAKRGVKEETIDELNRYEKETGKSSGPAGSYRGGVNTPSKGTPTKKGGSSDKLVHFGKGLKRSAEGRPTGQTRRSYDKRGEEGNTPTPVEKIKKYLDAKRAAKADPSQGRYPPGSRKD